MWARRIHDHRDSSHEQNFFLDLVLGLVASTKRLRALTWVLGPNAAKRGDELHALDAFVLGLFSFSAVLGRRVEEAAPPAPPAAEIDERPAARPPARDLLL